jgi:hypothetical protein
MLRALTAMAVLVAALAMSASAADAPLPEAASNDDPSGLVAPQDGVVVLKNGQVIAGKITTAGDYYYVTLPAGEIRLKATEVELACRDLEEAYRARAAKVDDRSVQSHLRLADWCTNEGLLGYAATHLAAAMAIDHDHPGVSLVERKLDLAQAKQAGRDKKQAPMSPKSEVFEPEPVDASASIVGSLPPAAVEEFVNHVQPVLINRCTTSGCHSQPATSGFRLWRPAGKQGLSQRLSTQNLESVLEYIADDSPELSPLLIEANRRHGTQQQAALAADETKINQELASWVQYVCGDSIEPIEPRGRLGSGLARRASASPDAAPAEEAINDPFGVMQASYTEPIEDEEPPQPAASPKPVDDQEAAPLPVSTRRLPPGVKRSVSSPAPEQVDRLPTKSERRTSRAKAKSAAAAEPKIDEFDPEIFNRQSATDPATR